MPRNHDHDDATELRRDMAAGEAIQAFRDRMAEGHSDHTPMIAVPMPQPLRTLPCTMDDAHVSLCVGPAIRDLVGELVDAEIIDESHRAAAEVLVASFFVPLLAREDRIAAHLGLGKTRVRTIGRRLRAADIWRGDRLMQDCYDMLFDDDPQMATVSLVLFCGVATGKFFCWRGVDGEFMFALERPAAQVHYDGETCGRCGTATRYTSSGGCVECQRRYMRDYTGPRAVAP